MGELLERLQLVWSRVNLVQRVLLIAVGLTVVGCASLIVYWARKPDMRPLYQGLSPEDAAKVMDKIDEKGILSEIRHGGTSVFVPQEHVYRLRLEMAKEGLVGSDQKGFKIFDEGKIGESPFVQDIKWKRALQDELAKSVQMIDAVNYARVHIDNPDQGVFNNGGSRTRASVVVRIRPGYHLSSANVAAIANLVAGSISGLEADRVTVVDTQGSLLSSQADSRAVTAAGTYHEYKTQVENSLREKVMKMLATILGPDKADVQVSADLDMKEQSTLTETPVEGVASKTETDSTKDLEPGTVAEDGKTVVEGSTSTKTQEVTEYENGRTVVQETTVPGVITALSVAVAVDLRHTDPNATGLVMEELEVEEMIRSALGLKEGRDTIKVTNVAFQRNVPTDVVEASSLTQYLALARQASMGIMAVCALLVLKIFSGAKKKAAAEAMPAEGMPALAPGDMGLLPAGEAAQAPTGAMVQKQVAQALQNNPDQVRQLFAKWIEQG